MLQTLWEFIQNPIYEEDENTSSNYRLKIAIQCLFIGLGGSILIVLLTSIIEGLFDLDMGKHAMDELLENTSVWMVFFLGIIVAPCFEELIFRGPLIYFRDKSYFKFMFYLITIIFGLIHITNFEISTKVLVLAPLLVAPQIFVGAIFGYIRIRFGLLWSMGLHAAHNLILFIPLVLAHFLDIPIE